MYRVEHLRIRNDDHTSRKFNKKYYCNKQEAIDYVINAVSEYRKLNEKAVELICDHFEKNNALWVEEWERRSNGDYFRITCSSNNNWEKYDWEMYEYFDEDNFESNFEKYMEFEDNLGIFSGLPTLNNKLEEIPRPGEQKKIKMEQKINELKQLLLDNNIAVLTPYPNTNCEDFTVSYVEKIRERKSSYAKIKRFSSAPMVQIVTEEIGEILNRKNIAYYLGGRLGEIITTEHVEICFHIMSILIRKANHIEKRDNIQTSYCHDDTTEWLTIGHHTGTKYQDSIEMLFGDIKMAIPCYPLSLQDDESDIWTTAPHYTLIELLNNKKKLRVFFDFWRNVSDYKSLYIILNKHMKLPPDIANLIICMSVENSLKERFISPKNLHMLAGYIRFI